MTADVFGAAPDVEAGQIDPLSPQHVVSLVQFLASPAAAEVNGQVFIVYGPQVTLVSPPHMERRFSADGTSWDPTELTATLRDYFAGRDPEQSFGDRSDASVTRGYRRPIIGIGVRITTPT